MPDAVDLIKAIKKAAVEAVKASKPVEVCFGKVISVSPLKILVEQNDIRDGAACTKPKCNRL